MTATQQIPSSVSPEQAEEMAQDGAQILDVRTPSEFESLHIPGSHNVPLDQLSEYRHELTQAVDKPVILVCASGMRAKQAGNTLREAGLNWLTILDGGVTNWEQHGQPVIRGTQRWSLERQVRFVAGSLVLVGSIGGLLVWPPLTLLSLFVGGGLTFAALTNTCGMAAILSKLPYNQGSQCDVRQVINDLSVDTTA